MPVKIPELLAPAGSFMAAYYAFAAGADAVYVGLRRFSARGSAQNFNRVELAKLKTLALKERKKIYVALNTVVTESETDDLVAALADCERLGVDGIIVQDAGVLTLAREYFPRLPVHASTQMAVGNAAGLAEAVRLGIRRVVLPRELSFDAVRAVREKFPGLEIEVFIHGALCYSYSGLCLASGLMGGGSGNRGACAQVCRLRFAQGERSGHFLSCRDLFSGPDARRLADIGVDSLKIEGRLKPASYVYHCTALHRFILDHEQPEADPAYSRLLERCGFNFTRERTKGRLFGGVGERLVTSRYERSVGFPVGQVENTDAASFSFTASAPIAVNDVLQVFLNESERTPYKLPVRKLFLEGASRPHADRGAYVTVESGKIPDVGQEIAKVYARDLELPGIRHKRFAPFATSMSLAMTFISEPAAIRIETIIAGRALIVEQSCSFDKPERREDTEKRVRQTFAQRTRGNADDPQFRFEIEEFRFEGQALPQEYGVGNRQLKIIRDEFLRQAAQAEAVQEAEVRSAVHTANCAVGAGRALPSIENIREFVKNRERLNPPVPPLGLIPFYLGGRIDADTLARTGDAVFIPLKPVVGDDESDYTELIGRFIQDHPELTVYVGVNNLGHLAAVRVWERHTHVYSFIDFFFYLANAPAVRFVRQQLARVAFGYYWIEGGEADRAILEHDTGFPLFGTGPSFRPPYFLHAGDLARESLGLNQAEAGAEEPILLGYDKFTFEAVVKNGFTYIFPA
jgi:putative protease